MKNVKKTTVALSTVIEEIVKLKGQKFTIIAGINLLLKLVKLGFIVKDFDDIMDEFKSMTSKDRQTLCEEMQKEFDIENDVAEEQIEASYEWMLGTFSLIRVFTKKQQTQTN